MELKELYENTLRVFECKDTEELKNKLYNVVLNNEINIYNEFLEIVNYDLSVDWMQKIFQYYEANRKEKMQDFTPKSLSRFVARLAKHNEIIDMCAGSGALSIQKWNLDKDSTFTLYEFDENELDAKIKEIDIRLNVANALLISLDKESEAYKKALETKEMDLNIKQKLMKQKELLR